MQIVVVLSLAALLLGCDSDAYDEAASETIVDPTEVNLARNGGFEEGKLDWEITVPDGAHATLDDAESWSGNTALRIKAEGQRVREAAYIRQRVSVPSASQYSLRLRARTRGLNRRLNTELRLTYPNGLYDFFQGHVPGKRADGIPPGDSDWQPVEVIAKPNLPITEIVIYPIDTGPGRLRGTVWVDEVELHARG